MKFILRAAWLLLLAPAGARACDACGCSAAGPATLGLLPATTRPFAGFSFQYQGFHSTVSGSGGGENIEQRYTTAQLWGRIPLGTRFQLYAFAPYRFNQYSRNEQPYYSSGIGDISVLLHRVLLRREATPSKPAQVLLGGIGVKAPTGTHHSGAELDRLGLPNSQPGTGAWDGLLAASYTATWPRTGISAEASYTLTTPNADDQKYGNRLGVSAGAFLRRKAGRADILPMGGIRLEHLLHDYDRYSRRWLDESTGGTVIYGQMGLQAYRGKLGASAIWSVPLAQAPAGTTRASSRIESGVTLFF